MKFHARKILGLLAILSGGLLLLFGAYLVEEHIRGRLQLNRWMKQMRTHGEKFTVAELTPPPVPPDQNGAGLLLAGGFGGGKVVPKVLPPAMRYTGPGRALAMAHQAAWTVRKESEIGHDTNGVAALWRTNTGQETPLVGGRNVAMLVTHDDLAADLVPVSNHLARVRAALDYSGFDFGLDYSKGFNIPLSHLGPLKTSAQWLRAASLSALYETNLAASLEHLLALIVLPQVLTNERLMISQLVQIAMVQIAMAAVWEALQVEGWSEEQLTELQQAVSAIDVVAPMTRALEMERAMGAQMIEQAADDPVRFFNSSGLLNVTVNITPPNLPETVDESVAPLLSLIENLAPLFNRYIYSPVWRFAWKDQDKLHLLQYWQHALAAAREQLRQPAWAQKMEKGSGEPDKTTGQPGSPEAGSISLYDRYRFLLSSQLEGMAERTLRRAVYAEASRDLALTDLAVRRFQLAQGRAPENLDQLVPKYLPRVPTDPFDGRPLRYRMTADGTFTIYSVGHDGVDDGGNPAPELPGTSPQFLTGRDLVWPRAATAEDLGRFLKAVSKRGPALQ